MAKEQTTTTIVDEKSFAIPLPIVISTVLAAAAIAIWGVRQLDGVRSDISNLRREIEALRSSISAGWTLQHQREWVLEAKQKSDLPDPDVIFKRNQPK